jgi:Ca2+-binding RTX toxin-like protein
MRAIRCESGSRIGRRGGLLALILLVVVGTAAAVADDVSGNGTLVGTPGNDTITAGNGRDTIWGLGGDDMINAGNGEDVIYAGGTCTAGISSGDYPDGLPGSAYCENTIDPGNDTITAGNGRDTIYGAGGTNTINVGNGRDTIYAGGGPDTITVGTGRGTIYAQNGQVDHIRCKKGNKYTVYADAGDVVTGCRTVMYASPAHDGARHRRNKQHHRATQAR